MLSPNSCWALLESGLLGDDYKQMKPYGQSSNQRGLVALAEEEDAEISISTYIPTQKWSKHTVERHCSEAERMLLPETNHADTQLSYFQDA